MADFKEYIASRGTAGAVPDKVLARLVQHYEWFSAARIVRAAQRGTHDGRLEITSRSRAAGWTTLPAVDAEALTATTSEDIIDRFLHEQDLRIVAREDTPQEEVCTEAKLAEEDDVVSEELAEVYLAQGLREEAIAVYRKLSLRNPEKSIYFAKIIETLETNN